MYKSYLENINTYVLFCYNIIRDHEDFCVCMYITMSL